MTNDELKNIFSRFQNLNLLVLREDLRRGIVCQNAWISNGTLNHKRMCPLQHGTNGYARGSLEKFRILGLSCLVGFNFTEWWDRDISDHRRLVKVLDEIIAERMADADAVQAVIEQPQVAELVQV